MAGSAALARIRADLLAALDAAGKAALPWHRAARDDGTPGVPKHAPDGRSARALLAEEGVAFDPAGRIRDPDSVRVAVAALPHGVPAQTRPAHAGAGPRR